MGGWVLDEEISVSKGPGEPCVLCCYDRVVVSAATLSATLHPTCAPGGEARGDVCAVPRVKGCVRIMV